MNNNSTRPDSQAVRDIQSDPVAIAALLDLCGLACVSVLASRLQKIEAELDRRCHEIAGLKLKAAGIEQENEKLKTQLKKRFSGLDSRVEELEKRCG